MSTEQRRHMSVYERTLEKFARTPFGDWYMKNLAPRLDPPMLRLTGGRVSSVYPVPDHAADDHRRQVGPAADAAAPVRNRRRQL